MDERFLHWLSWAAMAAAALIAGMVCWHLWQAQGRMEMLYRGGRTHLLPLGMRILLAVPTLVWAIVPIAVAAACLTVQTRLSSRVVGTLFHLFVMGVGLGCFLMARDIVMSVVLTQAWGGPAGR